MYIWRAILTYYKLLHTSIITILYMFYFDTILYSLNIDKALTMSPEGSNNINDCLYVSTIMAHVF